MLLYRLLLKSRAKAWRKAPHAEVPTICVGNITVGGTGKTPHTEMILDMLQQHYKWGSANLAVLSRGYKRRSRGFQQVMTDSTAAFAGDEPLQIKRKFPAVTVAVDKDRVEGCSFLVHPEKLQEPVKKLRRIRDKQFPPAGLIVLDDAFQYNKLHADLNIVLVDYNRPLHTDRLLPFGRLRDLPERIADADVVIVTKCPYELDDWERTVWAGNLGLRKDQTLLFSCIEYLDPVPVFPETDSRYSYSKSLVLFTGIANDTPLRYSLSDKYRIVEAISFPDHHKFSRADMTKVASAVRRHPTAALFTTEKDAGRVLDCRKIPAEIKQRLFHVPIRVRFLTDRERELFEERLSRL